MADEKDVLLAMYNDECTHRRHHETQRSNVANLLLAISSALIGVMLVDGKLARPDHYLGIFMFLIAIFGILLTAKLYERFDLHRERAKKIRYRLDHLSPTLGLEAMRDDAEEKTKKNTSVLRKSIFIHCGVCSTV